MIILIGGLANVWQATTMDIPALPVRVAASDSYLMTRSKEGKNLAKGRD